MRAWVLLLLLRRASAAEPCAPCMAAHPMHPFKWGACMPARERCAAPNGVELLVVRGTGNKWFAEDFLDQLRYFAHGSRHLAGACDFSSTWRWSEARTTVFVAPGTRTPHGLFALPIAERERQSYVAILRHPVMRVVSRYWFEGIWGQHQPEPETKLSLGAWVNKTRFPVFQKPNHLWNVPDNLYSKTFGGWRGEAACEAIDPMCIGGVGAAMVGRAERALEHIDGLVLTEWLGAPAQIELLARKYCFATDGRGRWPGGEKPSWWHFHRPRRAGGGHGSKRPAGWAPSTDELALIVGLNNWDLRLFARAAETVRRRVEVSVGAALAATLPELAPPDVKGLGAWLRRCPAPSNEAAGC